MFEAIFFTYGLLTSFVLSGAARNRKLQRANPPMLEYCGYVLFGCSAALSAMLFGLAGWHMLKAAGFLGFN
jgi:hypothetical protein